MEEEKLSCCGAGNDRVSSCGRPWSTRGVNWVGPINAKTMVGGVKNFKVSKTMSEWLAGAGKAR